MSAVDSQTLSDIFFWKWQTYQYEKRHNNHHVDQYLVKCGLPSSVGIKSGQSFICSDSKMASHSRDDKLYCVKSNFGKNVKI